MSQSPKNQNQRSYSREAHRKNSTSSSRSNSRRRVQRRYSDFKSSSQSQSRYGRDKHRQSFNNNKGVVPKDYSYGNRNQPFERKSYGIKFENNYDNKYDNKVDTRGGDRYSSDLYSQQNREKSKLQKLTMRRYRESNESLIRVHFFIKDCFMEKGNVEAFLKDTKYQIQKCGQIDIIQLFNCHHRDEVTDIAVGMRLDDDAEKIVDGTRIINLIDRDGKLKSQRLNLQISPIFEKQLIEKEKSKKKSHVSRSRSRSHKKKSKSYKKQQNYDQKVMIFGIPLEIEQEELKQIFTKKKILPVSMDWKEYNNMQYLLCQFETKEQYENILKQPLILDYKYTDVDEQIMDLDIPVLVIKEVSETDILQQLGLHQVRINYKQTTIAPLLIYKIFSQNGTIVNLFQDQEHKFLQIIYAEDVYTNINLKIPTSLNIILYPSDEQLSLQIDYPSYFEHIKRLQLSQTIHYQIKRVQQNSNQPKQQPQQPEQQQQQQQKQQQQIQEQPQKQIEKQQVQIPKEKKQPKSPSPKKLQLQQQQFTSAKKSSISRSYSSDSNENVGVQIVNDKQEEGDSREREREQFYNKQDNFSRNKDREMFNKEKEREGDRYSSDNRDKGFVNRGYSNNNYNNRGSYNRGGDHNRRGGNEYGTGRYNNRGSYGNYANNRGGYQDRRDGYNNNNRGGYDNRNRSYGNNSRFNNNQNRR